INMSKNTNTLVIRNRLSRARLEQHTKIFASMCPDEILDYYDNYETREYDTTLMLGDVSGIITPFFFREIITASPGTESLFYVRIENPEVKIFQK
ncbi:hypothetical protein ALC53_06691, partial [Atta colombica]